MESTSQKGALKLTTGIILNSTDHGRITIHPWNVRCRSSILSDVGTSYNTLLSRGPERLIFVECELLRSGISRSVTPKEVISFRPEAVFLKRTSFLCTPFPMFLPWGKYMLLDYTRTWHGSKLVYIERMRAPDGDIMNLFSIR